MASNAAFSVMKEFLPDIGRRLVKKQKKPDSKLSR
jgi:hypothetical protein